jgi:hypothetical protein
MRSKRYAIFPEIHASILETLSSGSLWNPEMTTLRKILMSIEGIL